jgi:solute carrier family 50 protein (sugar transporter)
MAEATAPFWVSLCGKLAPAAAIVVFMAPIPTIRQISQEKSVQNYPLLPYSSMVASCFLWCFYGILKHEPSLLYANGTGLFLGIYYFCEFIRYAPKKAPTLPGSVMQHLQGCCAVIFTTAALTLLLPTQTAARLIGNMGVVFCVCMFASPLAALRVVLETKSAASIPLPFTLASVLNCFLWSVIGLFQMHDFNIYAPNLLGLSFGLIQVALKLKYRGDGLDVATSKYSAAELTA